MLDRQCACGYTVLVIGEGPEKTELLNMSRRLGLENRVRWVGWTDYGSLGSFLSFADLMVFPSLEDVWGMVALEAMAFGKPVLCSSSAGVVELIEHGSNGYIYNPLDPLELASLLQEIFENPTGAQEMGRKAQAALAKLTPSSAAKFLFETGRS
jgi:glycosyltransferase involved in cell wall biosynthesis